LKRYKRKVSQQFIQVHGVTEQNSAKRYRNGKENSPRIPGEWIFEGIKGGVGPSVYSHESL
jgi:hypothetical protein